MTHNFSKLLPFLFNLNTLVIKDPPVTYTNMFYAAMLAVFATYNIPNSPE